MDGINGHSMGASLLNDSLHEATVQSDVFYKEVTSTPKSQGHQHVFKRPSTPTGLSTSAPHSTSGIMNGNMDTPGAPRSASGNKIGEMEESMTTPERKYTVEKVKVATNHIMYPTESYQDTLVPFPRTCGARFCSNDYLVMFNVPSTMKKVYEDSKTTPRALSELVSFKTQWYRPSNNGLFASNLFYGSSPQHTGEGVTISDWFTEKNPRQRHHRHGHRSHQGRSREAGDGRRERDREHDKHSKRLQKVSPIKVYNISAINPVSRYLAENYKIDLDNIVACCEHNANVAKEVGRRDLVQLWTLICHMSHPSLKPSPSPDHGRPWAVHPFGRKLVEKFMKHYSNHYDVQTLAMICCMFWDRQSKPQSSPPVLSTSTSCVDSMPSFEYAVASESKKKSPKNSMADNRVMKGKRSMSWSESPVEVGEKDPLKREMEAERQLHQNNCKMLNPAMRQQHEQIKQSYANILYNWQLLNQRTQLLKHTVSNQANDEIEFQVSCSHCHSSIAGSQCYQCKYLALNCSICHVGVRGPANVCLACGHGGHSSHMLDWFSSYSMCATGCGCNCLTENRTGNIMQ